MNKFCLALISVVIAVAASYSQVQTGTPPFGSFDAGQFDTINLANLNVHTQFPILSRVGRGIPFSYSLKYDSSFWYPAGTSPNMTWSAASLGTPAYGWNMKMDGLGSLSSRAFFNDRICGGDGGTIYDQFRYTDINGIHPFNLSFSDCGWAAYTATATDGSGIILNITEDFYWTVTLATGNVVGPGSITDTNGNTISTTGSTFTDTLDSGSSHVLTVQGTPPTSYNYLGPSGILSTTVNYTNFNLVTNFSCNDPSGHPIGNASSSASLITQINMPDGSHFGIAYEAIGSEGTDTTGRITEVTLPTGGKITYAYGPLNCSDGRVTSLTKTVYKDSNTVEGIWTYTRPAGSNATVVTDPAGNDTVVEFQDIYETRRRIYTGTYNPNNQSEGLLQTTETCYNGASFPCTTTPITSGIAQVDRREEQPSGKKTETDSFYNEYGLLIRSDEYDIWVGAKPSQPLRRTTITYASLTGIVGRPYVVQVSDGSNNPISRTTYAYDEGLSGVHGNVTRITRDVDGTPSHALVDTFSYGVNGLVLSHTDPAQRTTNYHYEECNNSLLTSVEMPLNLTRSQHWNCDGGVLASTTDENNQTTFYHYFDPNRWKPTAIDFPADAQTTFAYSSSALPWTVSTSQKIDNNGNSIETLVTLDGLGRTSKQQLTSGSNATVDTEYDNMGRIWKTSNPYYTTSDPTYGNTVYEYDRLGRVQRVTHPDESYTTSDHSEYTQTVTDEMGHQRRFISDGLGRLVRVDEPGQGTATHANGSFAISGNEQSVPTGSATSGTGAVVLSGSLQSWQTQTAPATSASGSVTINGSLQSKQVQTQTAAAGVGSLNITGQERSTQVTTYAGAPGTGSVTISGAPQHKKVCDPGGCGVDWWYVDNLGPVSITVNGFTKSAYASGTTDTSSGVASRLASAFNSDGNSPVNASSAGAVVYLTSKTPGVSTNYSLATSCSYDSTYFTSCAFTGARSGANLTGGQDPVVTTVYDSGTVTLVVNGFGKSVSYAQGSSTNTVASGLANAFNGDGNSPVTVSLAGSSLTLTAKQTGAATNYGFSTSAGTSSGYFSGSSFGSTPGSGTLTGGRDNLYTTVYDSGTILVSINGYSKNTGFGQGSSASGLAATIASAFANDGSAPVTASSSGNVVSFTTRQIGAGVNYTLTSSASYDTGNFSGPSFITSNSGGTLTGGQNAQYRTDYDSGTTTVTVNNQPVSFNWSGAGSTSSSIASGVAAAINSNSSFATATSVGSTVSLTARTTGAGTNYSLSSSSTSSHNSFVSSPSGSTLTGGSNAPITYDAGTISLTVGSSTASVNYNSGSTAISIANSLAAQLSPSVVTVNVSGATINLTSVATGSIANLSLTASSSTNYPSYFTPPSFAVSKSGENLTGGLDSSSTPYSLDTPATTVYSYNLLDNLIGVNQSGQTRSFEFDWLGRMKSETNPETGSTATQHVALQKVIK